MNSTGFDMLSLLRGLYDGQVQYRVNTLPDGSTDVEVAVGDPDGDLDHDDADHDDADRDDAKAEAAA